MHLHVGRREGGGKRTTYARISASLVQTQRVTVISSVLRTYVADAKPVARERPNDHVRERLFLESKETGSLGERNETKRNEIALLLLRISTELRMRTSFKNETSRKESGAARDLDGVSSRTISPRYYFSCAASREPTYASPKIDDESRRRIRKRRLPLDRP